MRNVVKGFQFSGMAIPKQHAGKINASFTSFHNVKAPRVSGNLHMLRNAPKSPVKQARRPGKNVGVRDGYKV